MLIGRYGVRHFWMADDIFGLKPGWVQRFRDIVQEKNLKFEYLGETKEDIEATLRLVEELMPDDIGISVSYPLPGTKFYENVKNLLGEKQNWEVSDDLAMMYPATFSQEYYRRLHRLVHKQFRLRQGREELRKIFSRQKADLRRVLKSLYYAPATVVEAWRLGKLENT